MWLSLVVWPCIGVSVLCNGVWVFVLLSWLVPGGLLVFVLSVSELFVVLGVGLVVWHCGQVCWCCL